MEQKGREWTYSVRKKRYRNMKKVLLIIFTILIILAGIVVSVYINKMNKIDYVEIAEEEIEVSAGIEEKLKKRIEI